MVTDQSLRLVVGRLLNSELYLGRLRRTLKNGWDPKVLTDFLVLDDVFLWLWADTDERADLSPLFNARQEVFAKALKSALRLDVRGHGDICKLEKYLRSSRLVGLSADQVFDVVYGKPGTGRLY